MQTTSDMHHLKEPRAMSMSDGMEGLGGISGGQVSIFAHACFSIFLPPRLGQMILDILGLACDLNGPMT